MSIIFLNKKELNNLLKKIHCLKQTQVERESFNRPITIKQMKERSSNFSYRTVLSKTKQKLMYDFIVNLFID